MSFEILEGQALKYRRGGTLESGVTAVIPEGQFFMNGTGVDVYDVVDTTAPVVFLNLVSTSRPDCTDGGVSCLGGPYTLDTDVYDSSASFTKFGAVTVKQVGASVSGLLTVAEEGDFIHGWVLQAPAAGNGMRLLVAMSATNDGRASA